MRISDSSSDVCSSDLLEADVAPRAHGRWIDRGIALQEPRKHILAPIHHRPFTGVPVAVDVDERDVAVRAVVGELHVLAREALAQRLVELQVRRSGIQRSEEHTSELQSLMRISYAVFCLKKKKIRYT